MKNKKKIVLIVATFLLLLITMVVGLIIKNTNNKYYKATKSKKSEFYLYKGNGEVYSFNNENKVIKLGEKDDILEIKYCEALGKYVVIDKDKNLCFLKENKQKEVIDKNVTGLFEIGVDDTAIYYMKGRDMYTFLDGKKQITKIEQSIFEFISLAKNKIYYEVKVKNGFDIYLKDGLNEGKKIAQGSSRINFNHDVTKAIYVLDKTLYMYDVKSQKSEKLINIENEILSCKFVNDKDFVYIPYPSRSKEHNVKVDLYYKAYGKESKKIGSNVNWISYKATPNGKGIFYLNDENNLYYRDFSKNYSSKICSDSIVSIINNTNDCVYVKDEDKNIYKINKSEKKERIVKDAIDTFYYKDKVAILDKNKNLYIGKNKISEGVEKVITNGDKLTYLTLDNKMFEIENENKPNILIEKTKEYKEIKFLTTVGIFVDFYNNDLKIEDIKGDWVNEDNNYMIKFNEENMSFVTKNHNLKLNIKEKEKYYKKLIVNVNDNCKRITEINLLGDKKIKVDGITYKKIDDKTFNDFLNKSTLGIDKSTKILSFKTICTDYFVNSGKLYFIYETTNECDYGPMYKLLDEENIEFDYWEFKRNGTIKALNTDAYTGND